MSQPYKIAAPADVEFELEDGNVYRVSGDPDVELVATLLELEDELQHAGELSSEELSKVVVRGRDMILGLIQEKMPDVESIRVGVSGIMQLIGLIVGNESAALEVAELLAEAAARDNEADPGDEEAAAVKRAEDEAGAAAEEDAEPVPLSKRSRKSSSGSAKRGSGRRTGGKAARGESSEPSSASRRAATG